MSMYVSSEALNSRGKEVRFRGTEGSTLRGIVQAASGESDSLWLKNSGLAFATKTEADVSKTRFDGRRR